MKGSSRSSSSSDDVEDIMVENIMVEDSVEVGSKFFASSDRQSSSSHSELGISIAN